MNLGPLSLSAISICCNSVPRLSILNISYQSCTIVSPSLTMITPLLDSFHRIKILFQEFYIICLSKMSKLMLHYQLTLFLFISDCRSRFFSNQKSVFQMRLFHSSLAVTCFAAIGMVFSKRLTATKKNFNFQ